MPTGEPSTDDDRSMWKLLRGTFERDVSWLGACSTNYAQDGGCESSKECTPLKHGRIEPVIWFVGGHCFGIGLQVHKKLDSS